MAGLPPTPHPRLRCTQPKIFWAGCKHHYQDLSIRYCHTYITTGTCLCQHDPDHVVDDLSFDGIYGHSEVIGLSRVINTCEWCRRDPKETKVRDEWSRKEWRDTMLEEKRVRESMKKVVKVR
jgi:hypothetical protein